MNLTVLVDNHTLNASLYAEPGFSAYMEVDDKKILFDTGCGSNWIENARTLNIDLLSLDYIAFSHGHHDHTNGLGELMRIYESSTLSKKPTLIAHPETFFPRYDKTRYIGSKITKPTIEKFFEIIYTKNPFRITDSLVFLGEIPRLNDFEAKIPLGKIHKKDLSEDDFILDDTALAYKSKKGLVLISGCSHSGICNITEYAKKVTGEPTIHTILGGLHLKHASSELIDKTIQTLSTYNLKELHACHCTGDQARQKLNANYLPQQNIGSGFQATYT